MSDLFDRREFVAGYLVEAEEHLQAANGNLLAIEAALHKNEPEPRRVRELFRALHTLKGLSGMVGVDPIVDVAHEMETVLRMADQGGGHLSHPALELLLEGVRAIEVRVAAFAAGRAVPPAPADLLYDFSALQPSASFQSESPANLIGLEAELLAKLTRAEQVQLLEGSARGLRAVRIEYFPTPALTAKGVSITTVRERVGKLGEIVKVIPVAVTKNERAPGGLAFLLLVLSETSLEELASAAFLRPDELRCIDIQRANSELPALPDDDNDDDETGGAAPLRTSSIRVDVARLDDAMEKLSELVVTRFRLSRAVRALAEQGIDVRELTSIVSENARQLRDLRGCITRARMVPVRELLERVPLIVRGMNRSTGKQVRLEIEAGTAELDKSVAERVFPAIVHLVRNAIDHAIEPPAERLAQGKPEQGLVRVSCFQRSNTELELTVKDDGRGMDFATIAQRAGRDVPRNEAELLELITLPGFSTVARPTSSSGRGMGMEIVKRIAVNSLGGSLGLRTTLHQGTAFSLRIPLSISIVDSFSFTCGDEAFVVPVSMVEEIVDLDLSHVVVPPAPGNGRAAINVLERRGEAVPLVSLGGLFERPALGRPAGKALIVRHNDEPFAFAIDRMLGQQEVVVRPLEDPLVKVAGVAGATDLGDGRPTLVLDLFGLIGVIAAKNHRALNA